MVRLQSTIMTEKEELVLGSLASIARLANRQHFYLSIGRFRAAKSPMALHRKNIATVKKYGETINSPAIQSLAAECSKIISKYE